MNRKTDCIIELFNICITLCTDSLFNILKKKQFSFLLFCLIAWSSIQAKVDRLRCSYFDDPSTTISISWDQVMGENPILHYDIRPWKGNLEEYKYHVSPYKSVFFKGMDNQTVRLKNLIPNTKYYFTIEDSKGKSREYSFETLSDDPEDRLSIIAGGDSRNFRKARRAANLMVSKLRPHFVLFGGDMTGGDTGQEWIDWMNDWQNTIPSDGRITPIVVARGNHEYSNRTVVDLFDLPDPTAYYSLHIGGGLLSIYTLNSLIASGGDQREWLKNSLHIQQYTSIWKMAQYHFPIRPHTKNKAERNDQRKNWASLFFKYGLDLAIESDAHVVKSTYPIVPTNGADQIEGFKRDDENGTVYIGEGCWGAPLRDNNDDKEWTRASGSFNQFKWIFLDSETMEIRTVKTDGVEEVEPLSLNNRFEMPFGVDLWNPDSGEVITLNKRIANKVLAVKTAKMEIYNLCATIDGDSCEINWMTTKEPNETAFEVQKSIAGRPFRTIAQIDGQGTKNANNYYKILDKSEDLNEVVYRLKKIAPDGTVLFYNSKLE